MEDRVTTSVRKKYIPEANAAEDEPASASEIFRNTRLYSLIYPTLLIAGIVVIGIILFIIVRFNPISTAGFVTKSNIPLQYAESYAVGQACPIGAGALTVTRAESNGEELKFTISLTAADEDIIIPAAALEFVMQDSVADLHFLTSTQRTNIAAAAGETREFTLSYKAEKDAAIYIGSLLDDEGGITAHFVITAKDILPSE